MGGVEVDADSGAALVPGLFAAGEGFGGMHGSNRLGGNSLSDLLVFGRRAGAGAADYLDAIAAQAARSRLRRWPRGGRGAGPAGAGGGGNPTRCRRGAANDQQPGRHHPPRGGNQDRPRAELGELARARGEGRRRRAAAWRTRAGTWPWTCATSCSSPSAWRWRRWNAGDRAAGTPGMTTGHVAGMAEGEPGLLAGRRRPGGAVRAAHPGDPAGPAGPVRRDRAGRVHDQRGAGRAARRRRDLREGTR